MNIHVNITALRHAVQLVGPITSTSGHLPVLKQIKLASDNDRVELVATDLDIEIIRRIPCTADLAGVCLIPNGILQKLKGGVEWNISSDDKTIRISDRFGEITLNSPMDVDQFPRKLKMGADAKSFQVNPEDLHAALKSVFPAISSDQSRYMLCSVLFEVEESIVRLVAVDGRRIHTTDIRRTGGGDNFKIIMRSQMAKVLLDGLDNDLIPVSIDLRFVADSNFCSVQGDGFSITGKVQEGSYPEWRHVWPKDYSNKSIINQDDFDRALKTVCLATGPHSNGITFRFTPDKLTLNSSDPGQNGFPSAVATVEVVYSGPELSIILNRDFVSDCSAVFEHKNFTLQLNDSMSPVKFSNEKLECLVMPMRQ